MVAAGAPAAGASGLPTGQSIGVVPLDGAHWKAGAGLSDARGNASVGLTQTVDGSVREVDVAAIRGLEGSPSSSVTRLGFAVRGLPSGIDPCWKVVITNPDGAQVTVELEGNSDARGVTQTDLGGGWTQWTFTTELPQGTINTIDLHLDVVSLSLVTDTVAFDNFTVNDLTASKGGRVRG